VPRPLTLQKVAHGGAPTYEEFAQRPTLIPNPISESLRSLVGRFNNAKNLQVGERPDKPRVDILYLGNESKVQIPRLAITYWEQYELSYLCAAMSASQIKLRDELFRHLGNFKPLYQRKCSVCSATYEDQVPRKSLPGQTMVGPLGEIIQQPGEDIEYCLKCQSTGTLVPPNPDELAFVKHLFMEMNQAGQDVWDALKQFEDDLNITDDAWLVAIASYPIDRRTGMLHMKVHEIIRGHPNIMRIVADGKGNRGGAFLSCPRHRNFVFNLGMTTASKKERGYHYVDGDPINWERAPRFCPKCEEEGFKVELRDVWYVATEAGGQKPIAYYFKHEVLHVSRYRPGLLYGVSPCVTLYREARSLIKMEEYIQEYFEKRMIPRGMVIIRRSATAPASGSPPITPPQQMVDQFKQDVNRRMADEPRDIPFVGISHADDIQFVPFADKIQEMEFIPVREEFKRNIASFYGLSPLFMAQTEESGGMNNESQQITVTNRALESAQAIYNVKVFPWIMRLCGVGAWKFELTKPERQDLINDVQLRLGWVELATGMKELGFKVIGWNEAEKKMVFSDRPEEEKPEVITTGLGGAGGDDGPPGESGGLGDESEGMSYKPKAPKDQKHEGSPTAQKRGANP